MLLRRVFFFFFVSCQSSAGIKPPETPSSSASRSRPTCCDADIKHRDGVGGRYWWRGDPEVAGGEEEEEEGGGSPRREHLPVWGADPKSLWQGGIVMSGGGREGWRGGRAGGALRAGGSSARSDRGQLSAQLMSLAASLIGLQQGGPAKFREPVEEKFSNWAGSMNTEHSALTDTHYQPPPAEFYAIHLRFFLSWFKVQCPVAHHAVSS